MGMAVDVGGGKGKKPRPVPVMNVTPLVDIALVVLIIFMLIVPMMEKGFWLNVPKKEPDDKKDKTAHEADNEDGPLVLTIDSRGVIRVNKTVLAKSEIPARLPRMLAAQPLPVIFFDAADNVTYGQAVEVMDIAKQSGARAIAMMTEKAAR